MEHLIDIVFIIGETGIEVIIKDLNSLYELICG